MVEICVKASKKYSKDFVKAIEEAARDIVEGRVTDYEELLKEYNVKPKRLARSRVDA